MPISRGFPALRWRETSAFIARPPCGCSAPWSATPWSIVDVAELEKQLSAAREAGYARTFEELELGLDAIAAAVFSAEGDVLAAIDVSGPAHRLQAGGGSDLVGLTKEAAADLSRRLGFRGRTARRSIGP